MSAVRCSVLIVDDEALLLRLFDLCLRDTFDIFTAGSAEEAETILRSQPIDILLTDQHMPGRTGIQLLEWTCEHSPQTIRLLMTGYNELDLAVDAINRGQIYYYILKREKITRDLVPILANAAEKVIRSREREQLLAQLREANQLLEQRVEERTRELADANQLLEQRARELERFALTDALTGLYNRRAMDELAQFEFHRHERYRGALAVGFIDIDHFKQVNTEYLLTGGDEALKSLGRTLTASVRKVDSVGRMGGEEFLVLAPETDVDGAHVLADRIRSAVESTPVPFHNHSIRLTVSVGFAVVDPGVPATYAEMCHLAAAALAEAKATGRNRCVIRTLVPSSSVTGSSA